MDIRQLRYFISVAENLSFTDAAKDLFVAQSAVSQQIADLEKKIGVQLFVRDKRSVKLTSAGSVLLKESISLVDKTEEVIKKTRQAAQGIIGNLKIGFLGYSERFYLPSIIKQFQINYPDVDLQLEQYNHGMLNEALITGELDIGFTFSFGIASIGGLEETHVFTESISAVLHNEHPLAHRDRISISELAKERFIVLNKEESPQGYNQTLLICANNGFFPNICREPRLLHTVLLLVESGMGIAILPKSLRLHSSPSLRFIDIDGEKNEYDLVVAWKKNNGNPSIQLFIKELEIAKKQINKT